jgi:hypothetical protein
MENIVINVNTMSLSTQPVDSAKTFACNRAIIVRLLFARPVGIAQTFQRAFALAAGY